MLVPVPTEAELATWKRYNFPYATAEQQALNIAEEAGEVCRAILKRAQGIRGTAAEWTQKVREEVADVALSLRCLALIEGFDYDQAVADRWAVIRQTRPPSQPARARASSNG